MAAVTRVRLAYNSVYAVDDGAGRVLIDTGPDFRGAVEAIDASLGGRQPSLVVATHGHLDHAGLGWLWRERGVPVSAGAGDRHLLGHPALSEPAEFRAFARYIEECGAPPELQATMLAGIEQRREWAARAASDAPHPPAPPDRRWPTGLRFRPFAPSSWITASGPVGESLPVTALLSPGHTPGNLALIVPAEGWLFSGDQLLPEITPTPAIQARTRPGEGGDWRYHSLPHFVASLRALEKLEFSRCFPGHGDPFDNVAETIRANLVQVEQRTEKVLAILRDVGQAAPFALCERLYPKAAQRRPWQILATVQGHLDLLESEGRVTACDGLYAAAV